MNILIEDLKEKVLKGDLINKAEAIELSKAPLKELCEAADEIRKHFCGDNFDFCTIVNGKNGKCPENCKYCAQSSFYKTKVDSYPLMGTEEIIKQGKYNADRGVPRYSIVTSGRKLSDTEVDKVSESIRELKKQVDVAVCVSFGLLDEIQYRKLKDAGVVRVHNNLESSRNYFPNVCTTHSYDEKIAALKAAQKAGLSICSGGIMGLGESMDDRIDMVLTARELGVKSVPVNMLNPIQGTPYENNKKLTIDDMCRIVAVFRFLIPDAYIRLAGGRGLMEDKGYSCFQSGANAAITGDMLTTSGMTIEQDLKMLTELGFKVAKPND